jgi:hypothetical protein
VFLQKIGIFGVLGIVFKPRIRGLFKDFLLYQHAKRPYGIRRLEEFAANGKRFAFASLGVLGQNSIVEIVASLALASPETIGALTE